MRTITAEELKVILLEKHGKWWRGETGGDRADLRSADLRGADLRSADLRGANLRGADLRSAFEIDKIIERRRLCPDGEFVAWKQLRGGVICKLRIPAEAGRVGGDVGRKCRAEYAIVIEGEGISHHDPAFRYSLGAMVRPTAWDPNPLIECSGGIHFFITKLEAEEYS